jgi:hypothetical protein
MGMPEAIKSKSFEEMSEEMDTLIQTAGLPVSADEVNKAAEIFADDFEQMLEQQAMEQSFMWTLARVQAINLKLKYLVIDEIEVQHLDNLRRELLQSLNVE